jgi:hypothetical protein
MTSDSGLRSLCVTEAPAICEESLPYLRLNTAQILSLKNAKDTEFSIKALKADPQVEAARKTLKK